MEFAPKKRMQLFAGRSNEPLAREVASHLGLELCNPNLVDFADGEIRSTLGESVRGSDVFILQTHSAPVNDHIMEQLIMIDAAKRASAKRITAVCPLYGYLGAGVEFQPRKEGVVVGHRPEIGLLVLGEEVAAGTVYERRAVVEESHLVVVRLRPR